MAQSHDGACASAMVDEPNNTKLSVDLIRAKMTFPSNTGIEHFFFVCVPPAMRLLIATTVLLPLIAQAQPDPPNITFTFAAELEKPTPLPQPYRVEEHFRYEA